MTQTTKALINIITQDKVQELSDLAQSGFIKSDDLILGYTLGGFCIHLSALSCFKYLLNSNLIDPEDFESITARQSLVEVSRHIYPTHPEFYDYMKSQIIKTERL